MGCIDLHVHTSASDGTLAPRQVVALAASVGVRFLGVADHDSTEGIAEAIEAAASLPVEIVPAVEINAEYARTELHILGYYVDVNAPGLQRILSRLRDGRVQRARAMVDRLGALGLGIEWERVSALAGDGAVGRPHVAQALVEKGHADTVEQAFHRYIGRGRPGYVGRFKLSPPRAIEAIRAAGGLPVLAHPLSLMGVVPDLARAGLAGLEAYYTGYSGQETHLLLELATKYGLLVTGGSDFHGLDVMPNAVLGGVDIPLSVIQELKRAAAQI